MGWADRVRSRTRAVPEHGPQAGFDEAGSTAPERAASDRAPTHVETADANTVNADTANAKVGEGAGEASAAVGAHPTGRRRRPWAPLAWLGGLLLVGSLLFLRVPYVIMSPGPAVNTLGTDDSGRPLIAIAKHPSYPAQGQLDFTTVTVRGGPQFPVTALDLITAYLTPHHEILPEDAVFPPNASAAQVRQESTAQMQSSQEAATVVALRTLGMTVPEKVLVASVPEDSPAAGKLHADDVVTKIDGVVVADTAAARKAVRDRRPGQPVTVTVTRQGASVDVPVTTGDRDGAAALGVYLRPSYTFPVDVRISAGDVGGPSAGTMFGLGIYDKLTPGDLTGGHAIAGTGALDPDGTVEPIGGIAEKMVAARSAGAEWFLAPASNCSDVVGNVPEGLHVVSVKTFADAVHAVTGIGTGQTGSLPTCR